ncbi:hypothetical protein J6590_100457, partial [Homalodisca vitripennis]
ETILHRDNAANVQARVSVANTLELYKQLDESYGHMNDKHLYLETSFCMPSSKKFAARLDNHCCTDVFTSSLE